MIEAVSARRMFGDKEIDLALHSCIKKSISLGVKPDSGPTKIAKDEGFDSFVKGSPLGSAKNRGNERSLKISSFE